MNMTLTFCQVRHLIINFITQSKISGIVVSSRMLAVKREAGKIGLCLHSIVVSYPRPYKTFAKTRTKRKISFQIILNCN